MMHFDQPRNGVRLHRNSVFWLIVASFLVVVTFTFWNGIDLSPFSYVIGRRRPLLATQDSATDVKVISGGLSTGSQNLHLLLPASHDGTNLCKTLLTAKVLGYPTPSLVAWNTTFEKGRLLGGGSHVAKISGVLNHLETRGDWADDDLVLMMDAYDIWFQLPPSVLLERYHQINSAADERIRQRLGIAAEKNQIRQTIIFGAGKRCAPNQMHTIACYPMPDSPLPMDIYGNNTDTVMGRNKYTSLRQRFLNSGYIIGPVSGLRDMFRRAWEQTQATKDFDEWDNGSHGSDFMYHGSDQSIFNIILGEQEYQREVLRRRYISAKDRAAGLDRSPPTWIEGTLIDDALNPSFTHQPMTYPDGSETSERQFEYGIGLDYWSLLGHQTVNSEEDVRFLHYDGDLEEQTRRSNMFDCPSRVKGIIPDDVVRSTSPVLPLQDGDGNEILSGNWTEIPLYTNLCLDTIPVMIHHNGDKSARERQWPNLWLQPHARQLLDASTRQDTGDGTVRETGGVIATNYASDDRSNEMQSLSWNVMCSGEEMEKEIFR